MKLTFFAFCLALTTPALAKTAAHILVKTNSPGTALCYSPGGQILASADQSGRVTLTDAKSGKTKQSLRYKEAVNALAFAPNGKLLAIGAGKQVRLLDPSGDMKTAKPVLVLATSVPIHNTLQFSADGRVLLAVEGGYSQDSQYVVEIWQVASGKRLRRYSAKDTDTDAAALSPDGKTFVALTHRFGRSLFSVATGQEIRTLSDHFTHDTPPFEVPFVSALAWSPDGKWIVGTGSYFEGAGHLTLWEAASGQIKWSRTFYDYGSALAWSPDSSRIAVGTAYDTTYDDPAKLHRPTGAPIFNAMSGQWQRSVQRVPGEINAIAWSPDGKTLATGHNKRIELWNMKR